MLPQQEDRLATSSQSHPMSATPPCTAVGWARQWSVSAHGQAGQTLTYASASPQAPCVTCSGQTNSRWSVAWGCGRWGRAGAGWVDRHPKLPVSLERALGQ